MTKTKVKKKQIRDGRITKDKMNKMIGNGIKKNISRNKLEKQFDDVYK